MNEANDFYQEMRSQREAVATWRDEAGSAAMADALGSDQSGNGEPPEAAGTAGTKGGTTSPTGKGVNLTPNG